jgi:hypothetical protein
MNGHDPKCELCAFADVHGWWGREDITHCRGCGATWGLRTNQAECRTCHVLFSTSRNFDRHLRAGEHRHPSKVGLVATPNKFGTPVWHQPGPDESRRSNRQSDETALGGHS